MKKLLISGAVSIYVISTVLFCFLTVRWGGEPAGAKTEGGGLDMNATDLGVMCISAAYPSMGKSLPIQGTTKNSRRNKIGKGFKG